MSEFKAIMDMVTEYYRLQSVAMRLYDKAVDHLTGEERKYFLNAIVPIGEVTKEDVDRASILLRQKEEHHAQG